MRLEGLGQLKNPMTLGNYVAACPRATCVVMVSSQAWVPGQIVTAERLTAG
jgi:hypothetical protein